MGSKGIPKIRWQLKTILAVLDKTYSITLKESDIQKPTSATLKKIFEALISNYGGYCPSTSMPDIEQLLRTQLEFPELHDDATSLALFNESVMRFMQGAGLEDFSLKDISNPDPQRTILVISHALNFAKYKSQHETKIIRDADATLIPILKERDALEADIVEKRNRLAAWEEKQEEERPQVEALDDEIRDMALEAKRVQEQRQAMQDENDSFQRDLCALEEQVNQVKLSIVEAKQEGVELRRQIVESPERLQLSLAELQENIEREEKHKDDIKKDIHVLEGRKANLAKAAKKVLKVKGLMDTAELEIQAQKEIRSRAKAAGAQLAALKRRVSMLEMQEASESQAVAAKAEQVRQSRFEGRSKEDAARQELELRMEDRERQRRSDPVHRKVLASKENQLHNIEEMEAAATSKHLSRKALRDSYCQKLMAAYNARKQRIHAVAVAAPGVPPHAFTQGRSSDVSTGSNASGSGESFRFPSASNSRASE